MSINSLKKDFAFVEQKTAIAKERVEALLKNSKLSCELRKELDGIWHNLRDAHHRSTYLEPNLHRATHTYTQTLGVFPGNIKVAALGKQPK